MYAGIQDTVVSASLQIQLAIILKKNLVALSTGIFLIKRNRVLIIWYPELNSSNP